MSGKQAVLLIHGIGEQRPMDSIREFVHSVWTTDHTLHRDHGPDADTVWSKPDSVSKSFELRRLTTGKNKNGIRTDFFEFYWAHMIEGTTFDHLTSWLRSILWRKPNRVPDHLKTEYWILISTIFIAFIYIVYQAWIDDANEESPQSITIFGAVIVGLGGIFAGFIRQFIFKDVVGDVARYLDQSPKNIKIRNEIRKMGINVLKELHSRDYYRIILVGHSLGSVIGYDILTHGWVEFNEKFPALSKEYQQKTKALEELEKAMFQISNPESNAVTDLDAIRALQRKYFEELRENGQLWLVTDFVTLGCPLAHGEILLARNGNDLNKKQNDREFPTCPPVFEKKVTKGQTKFHFSFLKEYEIEGLNMKNEFRVPHHAAVFGPTRWTNLYFPKKRIIGGDLIGGKISPIFGKAIKDIEVKTRKRWGLFSHTLYWTPESADKDGEHIEKLRQALNLLDEEDISNH